MTVLLVEDEAGIRDGLATVLGLRGLTVRTAADLEAARAELQVGDIACLVTDWRLPDGTAAALLDALDCPCVVISGSPGDVPDRPPVHAVLDKPVRPTDLVAAVAAAVESEESAVVLPSPDSAGPDATVGELPLDVRELLTAVRARVGELATERIEADGVLVRWSGVPRERLDAELLAELQTLGGDLQVHADGRVTLRAYRDGRPDGIDAVVSADAVEWPSGSLAIDLEGREDLDPAALRELLVRGRSAGPDGAPAPLLNVPASLRSRLDALGWEPQLPKRSSVGPRIPAALDHLWR